MKPTIDLEKLFFGWNAEEIRKRNGCPVRLPFHKAIEHVRSLQGELFNWDPKAPATPLANDLFERVKCELGQGLSKTLRLFCGVGTVLDNWHHADGFFQVNGGTILRFDLTVRLFPRSHSGVVDIRHVDLRDQPQTVAQAISKKLLVH